MSTAFGQGLFPLPTVWSGPHLSCVCDTLREESLPDFHSVSHWQVEEEVRGGKVQYIREAAVQWQTFGWGHFCFLIICCHARITWQLSEVKRPINWCLYCSRSKSSVFSFSNSFRACLGWSTAGIFLTMTKASQR